MEIKEIAKRAGAAAGRLGSRITGHTFRWIGLYICAPVAIVLGLILGMRWLLLPYIAESVKEVISGPTLPPKIVLGQGNRRCALVAAYHDGWTRIERLGAAMAHIHLANKRGLTTAEVYEGFLTLVVPNSNVLSQRSCTVDYVAYGWTKAQQAIWSVGEIALDECLADQPKCFTEHPWLATVQYEIRNTWKGATPSPDYRLRTDPRVKRVFPENPGPDDAEFFSPN